MKTKIKTRFAPSPTGFLHIGGLRTALFAYLIAKSKDGEVILRIEDTDQKREIEGAVDKLIEILDWTGIKFDAGARLGGEDGPYTQSKRQKIYSKYCDRLLASGQAYPCFCSSERLQKMREEQQANKQAPRYDRKCRDLSFEEADAKIKAGESYVIRQKMPRSVMVKVMDELRGEIKFNSAELEDHVLIKSNGVPTYQFAVVVDDHLMKITHIVRGEEWIPSFPKNILLYKAFGWEAPKFVHLPLVMNKSGGKLSKRTGDVSVENFKAKGYLPQALINFVALLGWSPYSKQDNVSDKSKKNPEILNLAEITEQFDLKNISISSAIFDTEKLDFLNGYYIRQLNLNKLVDLCLPFLNLKDEKFSQKYIKKVIGLEQERLKRLDEIKELTEFFFVKNLEYDENMLVWKKMDLSQAKLNLKKIIELLEKIPEENWTKKSIEDDIVTYLRTKELKIGEYLWPMRVALTGRKASPGPFEVAEVLGKKESLSRIEKAIKK
ncbi:MAG: glutamate--tRNA ligase [Patescibacteria group bacterium]|nr:glutamate--tRNA ligase [Patescibacteria group bacterium]